MATRGDWADNRAFYYLEGGSYVEQISGCYTHYLIAR